mmetsp:Transcript_24112/g.29214  ORF Transcript_24112/g.29214 Transcript_24112/m.29214 type:complete len:1292 (+) Transcript_24112:140-4015(+)|eukprot:CAMPEP_0197852630 /NCGR_PEP_ID=MMETSP1438-20131217/21102_1 /TAXON_ID=1461541 /ORGANISM="Pterosperma sp., Strain CCMP1384" /LENGTH=1291 /DNA_ID=CAMNT_0043466781 /DNA_START=126 /DNA_END=4001 /DNA_ORIENTATION=-
MADKEFKEKLKAAKDAAKREDFSTCLKLAKEGYALNKTSYEIVCIVGDAGKGTQDFALSEKAYREAINLEPKRERAYQGLRELFQAMHQDIEWDKCQDTLGKLVEVLKQLIEIFKGDRQKRQMYEADLFAAEKKKRGPSPPNRVRTEGAAKPATTVRKVPSKKKSEQKVRGERKNVDHAANLYMCDDEPKAKPAPAAPNMNNLIQVKQSSVAAVKAAPKPPPKPEAPVLVPFKCESVSPALTERRAEVEAFVDDLNAQSGNDISKVVVALIAKIAADKKKSDPVEREWGLLGLELLADRMGRGFEVFATYIMGPLIICLGDGRVQLKPIAQGVASTIIGRMHPECIRVCISAFTGGLENRDFKVKESTLQLFQSLCPLAPRQIEASMMTIYPIIQECINDTHPKVQEAGAVGLKALLTVVTQPEVQKIMGPLIPAILDPPRNTAACLDALMETTFINVVNSCSLSILIPIIIRGLKEPSMDLNKKAATAAGNICALVTDPRDIWPFVPALLPYVTKLVEHSHPDVRKAASRARESLLEGAGLNSEGEEDQATIATLSRSGSQNDLAGMKKSTSQGSLNVEGTKAQMEKQVAECKRIVRNTLENAAAPGAISAPMKEYVDNLVAVYVRDTREGMTVEVMKAEVASAIGPLLEGKVDGGVLDKMFESIAKASVKEDDGPVVEIPDLDYIVRIEKIILAFAGKTLLKKANLLLERGHRYGLVGQNGMGKTTLLNRIAAQDINGFPKAVSTYYIQHEILSEGATSVFNFMEGQVPDGTSHEDLAKTLTTVGFSDEMQSKAVTELSGGWRMKLAIARSMLWDADLLLLDEPTNHLDRNAITYLEDHLTKHLPNTTIVIVSHDYNFLQAVCTDIIHIADRALTYYRMQFTDFQKERPEIVAGLPSPGSAINDAMNAAESAASSVASNGAAASAEDASSTAENGSGDASSSGPNEIAAPSKPIIFPDPGKLDGIVGRRKPVMRMSHVEFKYETADTAILTDATVALCLSSRTALIGANGAGKTTLMKVLIGELNPTEGVGEVWRHHNLRLAYIAQHSMYHLEAALENTPLEYLQNRFYNSMDKEKAQSDTMKLTPEEKETMTMRGEISSIIGRQERGKKLWYECMKIGRKDDDTVWEPLQFLERSTSTHVMKLVKAYDEKLKADASGMAIRPITSVEVKKHLGEFGIDEDLAMGKIKRMSGGQKSRLVLAAAMWNKPHLIALDEPTNYLDNDTLAALTTALKTFKGGVVTISHNEAFVEQLCNEKWKVEGGTVEVIGDEADKKAAKLKEKKEKAEKKK